METIIATLEILSKDEDSSVRAAVVGNLHTPVTTLEILSKDGYSSVRTAVARNLHTPVTTLEILSKDGYSSVRTAVAENLNTPIATLEILSKDEYSSVRAAVVGNNIKYENKAFTIGDNYVAVKGTNHVWYKCIDNMGCSFYTCGCFTGSKEELLERIYTTSLSLIKERLSILEQLDKKFEEVFGRK